MIDTNHGRMSEREFEIVALLFLVCEPGIPELPEPLRVDQLLHSYEVDAADRDRARRVAGRAIDKLTSSTA
jgi:hypothetical protein